MIRCTQPPLAPFPLGCDDLREESRMFRGRRTEAVGDCSSGEFAFFQGISRQNEASERWQVLLLRGFFSLPAASSHCGFW